MKEMNISLILPFVSSMGKKTKITPMHQFEQKLFILINMYVQNSK